MKYEYMCIIHLYRSVQLFLRLWSLKISRCSDTICIFIRKSTAANVYKRNNEIFRLLSVNLSPWNIFTQLYPFFDFSFSFFLLKAAAEPKNPYCNTDTMTAQNITMQIFLLLRRGHHTLTDTLDWVTELDTEQKRNRGENFIPRAVLGVLVAR